MGAVGAVEVEGAVGVHDEVPAPVVDTMVPLLRDGDEVVEVGGPAVLVERDVVDVALVERGAAERTLRVESS